jgi:hypothetical protein
MKFWLSAAAWLAIAMPGLAQQATQPTTQEGAQQATPPEAPPEVPGKVVLSRSADDSATAPAASEEAGTSAEGASDPERKAVTFLSYDLDIHLRPSEHAMGVRARIQLRNDSTSPLQRIPLQISSSLQWTGVRVADRPAKFTQKLMDSDIDHTGALREAIIALAQPLAPQQTLALDVTYEGTAALSAERLERIGTPSDVAEASDWDRVSDEFIGLRGFGNVAWYPVASAPVALGDGAKFFTEAAAERQRQREATVTMKVTEEFFGDAPNVAVLDGETFVVTPTSLPGTASVPGIVTCTLPRTRLGLASPSLFLLTRTVREGDGVKVFARTEDVDNAQAYMTAATLVAPLIQRWLGTKPRGSLNIIDLPEKGDAPFEDGDVLFANLQGTDAHRLADTLVHSLTHLYFHSPYAWLQEGVPSFMSSLWTEQNHGRDVAIQGLDNGRGALSLAEPGDAGGSPQPLLTAQDPVYYRTKATYVFWMLRDLAGDGALTQALSAYQPEADVAGTGFEQALAHASGKDLKWFFDNWVNQDRGLPDLSISGVYPNKASAAGSFIVSVDVANSGSAEAEVPISVSSGSTTVTERVRIAAKSRTSHRFLLQGEPALVELNDGTVPEVQAGVHKQTLAVPTASE